MKATVDPDRCEGHARCWEICPTVFTLDEEGHATAMPGDIPAGLENDAAKAADNCPERAITLG
jgi:ferredoxin